MYIVGGLDGWMGGWMDDGDLDQPRLFFSSFLALMPRKPTPTCQTT